MCWNGAGAVVFGVGLGIGVGAGVVGGVEEVVKGDVSKLELRWLLRKEHLALQVRSQEQEAQLDDRIIYQIAA
jgi:hypothetical protein